MRPVWPAGLRFGPDFVPHRVMPVAEPSALNGERPAGLSLALEVDEELPKPCAPVHLVVALSPQPTGPSPGLGRYLLDVEAILLRAKQVEATGKQYGIAEALALVVLVILAAVR